MTFLNLLVGSTACVMFALGASTYHSSDKQIESEILSEELHWFNVEGTEIKEYIEAPTSPCLEPEGTILCAVGLTDAQIIGEDTNGNPIPDPLVNPNNPTEVEQRFVED